MNCQREISHNKTRGNLAHSGLKSAGAIQRPPPHAFKVGRDSGETRLLRVLTGTANPVVM